MYLRKGDILVKEGGYDVKDPWSRVVVWEVDEKLRQVALLPHTVLYVKNFKPGAKKDEFKIRWCRPEAVEEAYMIEEHAK